MDRSGFGLLVSVAAHVGVLVVSAVVARPLAAATEDALRGETILPGMIVLRIADSAEAPAPVDEAAPDAEQADEGGLPMGEVAARAGERRYGVQGPADNADPHIGRDLGNEQPVSPSDGLPLKLSPDDRRAPRAPWGRDDALGNDPASARGNMWGEEIDESFGAGGLGISGKSACGCGTERRRVELRAERSSPLPAGRARFAAAEVELVARRVTGPAR